MGKNANMYVLNKHVYLVFDSYCDFLQTFDLTDINSFLTSFICSVGNAYSWLHSRAIILLMKLCMGVLPKLVMWIWERPKIDYHKSFRPNRYLMLWYEWVRYSFTQRAIDFWWMRAFTYLYSWWIICRVSCFQCDKRQICRSSCSNLRNTLSVGLNLRGGFQTL